MKQYLIKAFLSAGIIALAAPSFAQDNKEKSKEKDIEQIIIMRKGEGADKKTVIEIENGKVKINGKNAEDIDEITVDINKLKDIHALSVPRMRGSNWNFNMDDETISLFSEDANRAMLGVVTDDDEKGVKISS